MLFNSRFLLLVGTVALALTVVSATLGSKKHHHELRKMDKKDVALFIEGVIEGVIEEEKFTDLEDCIRNTVDLED